MLQLVVAWQDLSVESFIAEASVIDPITRQLNKLLGFTKSLESCMDSNTVPQSTESEKKADISLQKKSNNQLKELIKKNRGKATEEFLSASLGGGYAGCGCHAILHLQTLRDAFKEVPEKRGAILAKLTSLWEVNDKFGLDGVVYPLNSMLPPKTLEAKWREQVKKIKDAANDDGEWLKFEGMDYLATQYLKDNEGTYFFEFHDQFAEGEVAHGREEIDPIGVNASDANSVYENYFSARDAAIKVAKKSGHAANIPTQLAFLVNTRGAHWYGIFVTTTPKLAIIVDSKNSPRYNHGPLKEILNGIFMKSTSDTTISNAYNTYFAQKPHLPSTKEEQQIEDLENLVALAPAADKETTKSIYKEMLTSGDYANLMLTTFSVFAPLREFFKQKFGTQGDNRLVALFQAYKASSVPINDTILMGELAKNENLYNLFTLLAEK